MKILVTEAAGFIGSALLCIRLLERGDNIVDIYNLNNYNDVNLKLARLERLSDHKRFKFVKLEISDRVEVESLFARGKFQRVMHLAAQAGVRYSLTNPHVYIDSNITGFMNILEGCRHNYYIERLAYALQVLFMERIRTCLFLFMIMSITLYLYLQLVKSQ